MKIYKPYKTYRVMLSLDGDSWDGDWDDCTEVDALDEAGALEVARDIFRENDYDVDTAKLAAELDHEHDFPGGMSRTCRMCDADIDDGFVLVEEQ